MSNIPPFFEIPKRQSLSAQAAGAIRKTIADGIWPEFLPSERRLCTMFQISRPTIRTALRLLAKDRLIDIQHGRRNRVLVRPNEPKGPPNRLVLIITPEPTRHMSLFTSQSISDMKVHLAERGFTTEIMICQARGAGAQRRKLDAFIRQNPVFCCVLLSVSKELQQWFSAHSIPALVLGSCHPDVKLPSLDVDHRSVCRHAAGLLLGKGHRRIALVVPHSGVAGYLVSEQGFKEAIGQHGDPSEAHATIVRHNGTARNITAKLDALFNSKHAPTAILVAKPQHVYIVIIYLLKRGLSVPDTVSLIARDPDYIFETVSPAIAHYYVADDAFAHRLSRLMEQLVTHGHLPPEPNLIFPKYFAGETVKTLP